jgi:TolB-like protein/Flp pilus assembly protein TadD
MSESTKAVFVSYAREDAGAGQRIAEALRSQGVEVWFDQNELRGGDSWDQKIRRQINDCTLFLPIISQRTQERGKGYFRLEWKLAVEQTHLMAEGIAFLAPVAIDDTSEGGAIVPAEFLRVQWTRLPGALPTPEFVAQVKRLLDGAKAMAGRDLRIPPSSATAGFGDPALQRKPAIPGWLWGSAAAALVLVAAGVVLLRKPQPPAAPPAVAAENKPAIATAPKDDKSIAVLPFENMSADKDNAYFCDGVQEDLLTDLANISELRVVSRTSVEQYRATTKPIRQIAQELGVAWVLEGSVQRAGGKVRVTGQLINARTDEHVWAKSYDRDLTDIFAIQTALSREIASALSAAISPATQKFIERRPTDNPAAYDAYLKARDLSNRSPISSLPALREEEELFKRAVQLDPNFAAAWGELARVHALFVFWGINGSAGRLADADAAIAQAVRLAPDAPEVIEALGTYAYYAYRDYARATEQYEKLARLQPNNATVYSSLGLIERRQGRWAESLASFHRAAALDPANISIARNMLDVARFCRRWDEARAAHQHLIALLPDQLREQLDLVDGEFKATGSWQAADALLARLTPAQRDSPIAIFYRKNWAIDRSDYAEFKRLDEIQPTLESEWPPIWSDVLAAETYFAAGDLAAVRARLAGLLAESKARLESEPSNPTAWSSAGQMEAVLGHAEEAVRLAR